MAGLLLEQGAVEDAEGLCRTALALAALDLAEAHVALGNMALAGGRGAEAVGFYRAALKADPAHSRAQLNLGNALQEAARQEDGRLFPPGAGARPGDAAARFRRCFANLPIIYRDMDELERARDRYARDLAEMADHYAGASVAERKAAAAAVGGSQPFYLAYQGRDDFALQVLYGDLVGGLMAERYPDFAQPLTPRDRGDGPLRVGFAAGHIGRHSAVNVSLRGWADAFSTRSGWSCSATTLVPGAMMRRSGSRRCRGGSGAGWGAWKLGPRRSGGTISMC